MKKREVFLYALAGGIAILAGVRAGRGTFTTSVVLASLFFLIVVTIALYHYRRRLRKRTREILADKERLQQQKGALHRLATSKALFSGAIEVALEEICESAGRALQSSEVSVWLVENSHQELKCAGFFYRDGHCAVTGSTPSSCGDRSTVENGEIIHSSLGRPQEKGVLEVPIYVEGKYAGLVRYVRTERSWNLDEQSFAASVADIVAMALLANVRRGMEGELRMKSSAVESATEGIAILDGDEQFKFCNQAHAEMYGYSSPKELVGKHWKTLYQGDELRRFETYLMPRFREQGQLTVEAVGFRKDGTTFPQDLSLTALDEGGLIYVVKDITLRKKVELNAEQVALFATLNPSPVLRVDEAGRIVMANPAAIDILGLMEKGRASLSQFLPEASSKNIEDLIRRAGRDCFSTRIKGRVFHFVMKGIPYLRVGHLYGTDITELKEAEDELRESKAFLRTIIDTNPNLIFVKDRNGRFCLVNQAVAELYGTTVDEIIGKRDADFNSSDLEVNNFRAADLKVIEEQEEKLIAEEMITDSTGSIRYLQTVKRPLLVSKSGEIQVLGVATDITERRVLQDQLIQSHKMEAIGKLAGGIAHDFNNILTGILGYTTLLKSSFENSPEVVSMGELIENAANKACQLTQKLLGFARKGKHRNVPIDLHASIRESLGLLGRTFEKNINIHQELKAECSCILGDPVQVQQILLNLAINARDAMSVKAGGTAGGELFISTREVDWGGVCTQEATAPRPGRYVELAVCDTGCGMDNSVREKIFDPFFTTKEEGRGTGMGLAMVYGIVKNHGGEVCVESKPGSGSSFYIYLPLYDSSSETEAYTDTHVESKPQPGHGQILLVDDHSVIRDATSKMLSSLGYDVATANDGVEAVKYYRENIENVDLVILDMVMPRMGARECFRAMKEINPKVRAILSTGYVNNNAVQEILNEGMIGFVQKPYQISQLSEVVAGALLITPPADRLVALAGNS